MAADTPSHPSVIIETPRLVLRAASDADIPVMYQRIFGDAEVMRHVFQGGVMGMERAEGFVRQHFTFGQTRTGIAILTEKADGNVIGFAGLFPCNALEADDFEIGFVMARQAWGRGYASEIGEAQLAMGFGEVGCRRLLGLVHPDNKASVHALTKLGLRYHSHVTSPTRPPRSVYVISADAWRDRRA
ncbi:MAG: GNAT family N-acetyltransferase [Pseudomonadota bacterium]